MDVYDPQTLGFMVFGVFMVISAIGIALVSTLSMKETSYEEALAKHRRELGKSAQIQLSLKNKKKQKALENKSKAKKKEERPNGNLPEPVAESISEPEPEPEPLAAPKPEPEPIVAAPEPVIVACAAPAPVAVEAAAPSPKKKKKVAKVAPAPAKPAVVPETIAKEVPVMVVPPVAVEVAPVTAAPAPVSSDTPATPVAKAEELKAEAPAKKKKSKAKAEPVVAAVDSADAPLLLPYKTLLSTVSSMMFSEGETQRLIEVLSDKAGLDSWQLASQKGDPMAALKKQLEEKEKQLSTEQEDATAAKNRLRELTKELSTEKSKMATVETRLRSELSAHTQEITALQARMQASYQDHVAKTQQLNLKIASLQEQLDNGPVAQLARLQQENSILRDALNQATSQAESRQNAELAKLRQDCVRLNRDLGERTEALQADNEHRKVLEAKVAAAEEQLAQFQACQAESERAVQQRLEEVSQKLQKSQDTSNIMQAQLDQAQQEATAFAELQERMATTEAELKERCAELEDLKSQQAVVSAVEEAAKEQTAPLEAAVETPTEKQETVTEGVTETPTATEIQVDYSAEIEELKISLITKEGHVATLEEKLQQLKVELELVRSSHTVEEPQINGVKEEEEQSPVEEQLVKMDNTAEIELLQNSLKEKERIVTSLEEQLQTLSAKMEAERPADTEQLQSSLKERESQVASLEEEFKQLREEMEQGKSANAESGSETEAEQPFESLEKDSQMLSLEEELQRLKEEMEQVRNKSNDLREKNWAAMEALTAAEKLNEERLAVAKGAQSVAEDALSSFQTEAQKALQMICPDISLEAEQNNWLELLIQKAQATEIPQSQEVQQENLQTTDSEELLSKLREAEESQKTLQAECEQYRTVLAETEGMLKDLQKSVEEEEHVWKAKIAEAEEQRQAALDQVKVLEQAAEDMKMDNESTDQLKEQVMLLEAQLEKQLESISCSQTYAEEVAQLKAFLTKTQSQLETAQLEAQKQAEELSVVQTQLEQTTNKMQTEEEMRQQLAVDFDQAQKCVTDLQTQMDQMKAAGDCSTGELKERLEKEKKLTKDFGQAATKLQQMLKATQEQFAKEQDTVKTLQSHLVGKEEPKQPKEGTSV
ncbi:ribosome-binding protein 1-like isoform X2 [Coregonus clupeaformis]|uniref:ribosome-binding protein 1-like isoform X2 n=1 Tax=Coregonus clupeaformis TaxID=59861 RepID=UPI001E1C4DB4|nr:ribosome-binding protein 1-like isoform X2 [Coregonus clupeaformis]